MSEINIKKLQEDIQNSLSDSLGKINSDFQKVTILYLITFGLGILLILISIGYALFSPENPLTASILGGVGILDLMTFTIFKPIEGIQNSRAKLAKILTAYICSINQIHNLNSAFSKLINNDIEKIDFDKLKLISDSMVADIVSILKSSAFSINDDENKPKKTK